jgi:hypothetical protein
MRQALHIFRKDVRHLWALIAVVAAIEVLTEWVQAMPSPQRALGVSFFGLVRVLAQSFPIIVIIQEEALPGHRQYWLTRPYSWRSLLLAKALFVVAVVSFPVFLTDAAALIARGQSPLSWMPSLITAQLFSLVKYALPVAALAVVTSSLIQFIWVFLAISAAFFAVVMGLATQTSNYHASWDALEWQRITVSAGFAAGFALATVIVQYRLRSPRLAYRLLGGLVLTMFVCLNMPRWNAGFVLLTHLGPQSSAAANIQIRPDPAAADIQIKSDPELFGLKPSVPIPADVHIRSVRLTGVPEGMSLFSDWTDARSEWGRLYREIDPNAYPPMDEHLLPGNGSYGLYGTPAGVPATLLSAPVITPLGLRQEPWPTPDGGLCWVWTPTGDLLFAACSWPARRPAEVSFRIHWLDTGQVIESLSQGFSSPSTVDYAPYPTTGFWQVLQLQTNLNHRPLEIALESRNVVVHFVSTVEPRAAGGQSAP